MKADHTELLALLAIIGMVPVLWWVAYVLTMDVWPVAEAILKAMPTRL